MKQGKFNQSSVKRGILFEISRKFHETINVDDVLTEVINTVEELYPYMNVKLYLSHDSNITVPIMLLGVGNTNSFVADAYRENLFSIRSSEDGIEVAVPITGSQGVYGIIYLTCEFSVLFTEDEKEFLIFIGETAGSAFQNAQLHQQSKALINELRLLNEISQKLNESLDLNEILEYITNKIKDALDTDSCFVFSYKEVSNSFIVFSSTEKQFEGLEYRTDSDRYLERLLRTKEPFIITDASSQGENGESFCPAFINHRSFMMVPLINNDRLEGAIAVFDQRSNQYSFEDYNLLQLIAQHTSLVIMNAVLHREIERMATIDTLTGLHTRKYFDDQVKLLMEQHGAGSLILIDIDHFKKINDRYGHQVGDEVLNQVAQIIKNNIRSGDIATRWGGEELAIYLPAVLHETALLIANRIREKVYKKTNPTVSISVGVSSWNRNQEEVKLKTLFHQADLALYHAKDSGRNMTISAKELHR